MITTTVCWIKELLFISDAQQSSLAQNQRFVATLSLIQKIITTLYQCIIAMYWSFGSMVIQIMYSVTACLFCKGTDFAINVETTSIIVPTS